MDNLQQLIEKIGVQLERRHQMPPVAARIIAFLVFKEPAGDTFENIVTELGASKSTISTHLSTLQATDQITYYTKPGDRKKYFVLSSDALIREIDGTIEKWQEEKNMHEDILDYKQQVNEKKSKKPNGPYDLSFHIRYLEFLNQATALIKNLRSSLIENHSNK